MAIVANDPKNLPTKILQIKMSQISLLGADFFKMIDVEHNPSLGKETEKYYMLNTNSAVSWLQPSTELQTYHFFIRLAAKQGYNHVMIIK
jgi:hypothetical protein